MRFCFIIESQYRNESMPMDVVDQLLQWGHEIDLLEPTNTVICLTDLIKQDYDAYVLRTVSDGPGLSILEAAEAVGIPTVNNSRSIRLVRDKAIAAAIVKAHRLPIPLTYFVTHPNLLKQIPEKDYPLVVKPTNGSSCRGIYRVDSQADLATLQIAEANDSFFLAQHYVENSGFDIKLYVAGTEVYAVTKRSPLHPEVAVDKRPITPTLELRKLALHIGKIFGLDIYGLDVVETSHGPVVVDVNDFPSYGQVPRAVEIVATHILQVTARTKLQGATSTLHLLRRNKTVIELALQRLKVSHALQLLNRHPFRVTEDIVWEEPPSHR